MISVKTQRNKQTNRRNMSGSFHTARLPVCRGPSVTLRAREQPTELLLKVAKWFHLLGGSSSSHRLRVATVLQVLSLSLGWSFTRGREARYRNEKPGVIWISNNNADSTFFSERFYPTFQILKKSRRSNRDDTVCRCAMLQDLSLFYGGKSVHLSCSWNCQFSVA